MTDTACDRMDIKASSSKAVYYPCAGPPEKKLHHIIVDAPQEQRSVSAPWRECTSRTRTYLRSLHIRHERSYNSNSRTTAVTGGESADIEHRGHMYNVQSTYRTGALRGRTATYNGWVSAEVSTTTATSGGPGCSVRAGGSARRVRGQRGQHKPEDT